MLGAQQAPGCMPAAQQIEGVVIENVRVSGHSLSLPHSIRREA
jgi:hypothetical protein